MHKEMCRLAHSNCALAFWSDNPVCLTPGGWRQRRIGQGTEAGHGWCWWVSQSFKQFSVNWHWIIRLFVIKVEWRHTFDLLYIYAYWFLCTICFGCIKFPKIRKNICWTLYFRYSCNCWLRLILYVYSGNSILWVVLQRCLNMVAYFCHHFQIYVDLSDLYVVLSDLYVDLSDFYVDLSLIHL